MKSMIVVHRLVIVAALLGAGAVVPALAPALAQGAPTAGGLCFSDPGAPVVYFSPAFDTRMNPNVTNSASTMVREFHAYLKARYGFTSNSNYPVSCGYSASVAVAQASRVELEGRMRREDRKVVDVDWTSLPDEAAAAASFGRTSRDARAAPPSPPADHGFCAAGVFPGPEYLSAIFDAVPPVSIAQWGQAWLRFLGGKYAYKGAIDCQNGTLDDSRRILKAMADGARIASRNVVETDWKFDLAANTAPAKPVDEDKEPVRPAAAAAATDARNVAGKEAPAILAYCQKDRQLSQVFECRRVQQTVLAYRIAHAGGAAEPLAVLFTGDKLDCTKCMDNQTQAAWARRTALAARLKAPVANCVAKEFVDRLKAKPYPNRVEEHYDAAVAACK
jgi:hypothetical protein